VFAEMGDYRGRPTHHLQEGECAHHRKGNMGRGVLIPVAFAENATLWDIDESKFGTASIGTLKGAQSDLRKGPVTRDARSSPSVVEGGLRSMVMKRIGRRHSRTAGKGISSRKKEMQVNTIIRTNRARPVL